MEEIFLKTQGPEDWQNRSQPGQRPSLVIGLITAPQPVSNVGDGLPGEGKGQLRKVEAARPAAEGGGIGQAIRVSSDQARPLPMNSHPQSVAAMPDSAPASCNACKGEKTTAEK